MRARSEAEDTVNLTTSHTVGISFDAAAHSEMSRQVSASGIKHDRQVPGFERKKPHQVKSSGMVIYRHLCSADNPPRSVAICPQTRHVAFGCNTGIELYWADQKTSRSQQRWIAQSVPSDHLYFQRCREDIDADSTLRLLSSASGTESSKPIDDSRRLSSSRRIFDAIARQKTTTVSRGRTHAHHPQVPPAPNHHQALPLSDGHHVLFTDPSTDCLCLGIEGPITKPKNLLQLFTFIPPENLTNVFPSAVFEPEPKPKPPKPTTYKAASDLTNGIRIVAAYTNDNIVFYTIPPDMFAQSPALRKRPTSTLDTNSSPNNNPDHLGTRRKSTGSENIDWID